MRSKHKRKTLISIVGKLWPLLIIVFLKTMGEKGLAPPLQCLSGKSEDKTV